MNKAFEAMYSRYNEYAGLKALVSGLYVGLAPQETPLPYVTVNVINEAVNYTGDGSWSDCDIQFSVFASSIASVLEIASEVEKCFSKATLFYPARSSHIAIFHTSTNALTKLDSEDCWQQVLEFRLLKQ